MAEPVQLQSPIDGGDISSSVSVMQFVPDRFINPLEGPANEEQFAAYVGQFQADLLATIPPQFIQTPDGLPRVSYYLRPPAAGPYLDLIFQLAQDFNAVVQTMSPYLEIGAALVEFLHLRKQRDEKAAVDQQHKPYLPVRMVEAICLHDAYERYYDASRHPAITLTSYSRAWYAGNVEHPLDYTQYVVTIKVGKTRYVYVVRATCDVVEHFKIEGGAIVGLENPHWYGDYSYFHDGTISQQETRVFRVSDETSI